VLAVTNIDENRAVEFVIHSGAICFIGNVIGLIVSTAQSHRHYKYL
jgi:hypothetical protein